MAPPSRLQKKINSGYRNLQGIKTDYISSSPPESCQMRGRTQPFNNGLQSIIKITFFPAAGTGELNFSLELLKLPSTPFGVAPAKDRPPKVQRQRLDLVSIWYPLDSKPRSRDIR